MLSSGGRFVCPPSYLVLSYLRLLPVCCLSLNAASPGFLRNFFYLPDFAPSALLLRLTELSSIEAEIDMRKLLSLGRLVTEPKMAPSVRNLPRSRTESLFDKDVKSIGFLLSICEALNKYDLFNYSKYGSIVQPFPPTATGNQLAKIKFVTWRVGCGWNFVLVIRTCMLHKLA